MKVIQISTLPNGGAGNAAYRLHLGLQKKRNVSSTFLQIKGDLTEEQVEAQVKTAYHKHPFAARIYRRLGIDFENKYKKILNKITNNYEVASFPRTYYDLENNIFVKDADIINLHWISFFVNYKSFFKKVKKPIVWTLHDMNAFQGIFHYEYDQESNKKEIGSYDKKIYKQKLKWIHQCDNLHIVCPSNWLKEKSEHSEILGRYPHYLIPYGLDIDKYPLLNRSIAKKEIHVDNNYKTILFVANGIDIYRKGFDILTESLETVSDMPFNLITIGGKKVDIKNKNIRHIHYEWISDTSQLNRIYSSADITIIPSREDNLPNVMLESFANGTPVLGFGNSGMAEHIKSEFNGILINEINSKALIQELDSFLKNKYKFNHNSIRQYAIDNFDEKLQVDRYINLYNKILKN